MSPCCVIVPGDDFGVIQQEILMMRDCTHPNIVAYYGSYLRFVVSLNHASSVSIWVVAVTGNRIVTASLPCGSSLQCLLV